MPAVKKSVAVTGHRDMSAGIDGEKLKKTLVSLIKRGYTNFYLGLALGFDTYCFRILFLLKNKYKIRLIGCAPFEDQCAKWNEEDKKIYRLMCSFCDERVVVSENYTPGCMMKRNRYMVDHADLVLAYLKKSSGGTYNTVKYAVSEGKEIVYI